MGEVALTRRRFAAGGGLTLAGCAAQPPMRREISVATFALWPGEPPGGADVTAIETVVERTKNPARPDRAATHVRKPVLKVFRPARPDGSAVLILPGGAYQRVVLDKEGDETARRLAEDGVTTAVLVYRLPGDGWAAGYDAPLQDAQRAMRLLRAGRVAARIDAGRVGVLGFSAGGNLAANLAFRSGVSTYAAVDAADGQTARPDFAVLIYAAYLDGKLPEGIPVPASSVDFIAMAGHGAQPMFLVHAADDPTVPVASTLKMAAALKAAGTPVEAHVFETGGHGFGIANAGDKPVRVWPDLFLAWGRARGVFG